MQATLKRSTGRMLSTEAFNSSHSPRTCSLCSGASLLPSNRSTGAGLVTDPAWGDVPASGGSAASLETAGDPSVAGGVAVPSGGAGVPSVGATGEVCEGKVDSPGRSPGTGWGCGTAWGSCWLCSMSPSACASQPTTPSLPQKEKKKGLTAHAKHQSNQHNQQPLHA